LLNIEDDIFKNFVNTFEFELKQQTIQIRGRHYQEPRLTAFFGDDGVQYDYHGVKRDAISWPDVIFQMKTKLEEHLKV